MDTNLSHSFIAKPINGFGNCEAVCRHCNLSASVIATREDKETCGALVAMQDSKPQALSYSAATSDAGLVLSATQLAAERIISELREEYITEERNSAAEEGDFDDVDIVTPYDDLIINLLRWRANQ